MHHHSSKDPATIALEKDISTLQKALITNPNQSKGKHSMQSSHIDNCVPFCSLAVPRNLGRNSCGQCSRPARWICGLCKNAFYCSKDHILLDNVHVAMCDLMSYTRIKAKFMVTKEQREKWDIIVSAKKEYVLNTFKSIGLQSMLTLQFTDARLAFQEAIQYAKVIYGHLSYQLSELFILKSECSLSLHLHHEALKELNAAESCLMDYSGEKNDDVRADLTLTYGLLHIARRDWDQAAFCIAEALVLVSFKYGPNSIRTARLYFHMGEIFHHQSRDAEAETFFIHSLQNYTNWMTRLFKDFYCNVEEVEEDMPLWVLPTPIVFEADALYRLKQMTRIFSKNNKSEYGKCLASFAFLFLFKGMSRESLRCVTRAKQFLDPEREGNLLSVVQAVEDLLLQHADDRDSGSKESREKSESSGHPKPNLQDRERQETAIRQRQLSLVSAFRGQGLQFEQKLSKMDACEQDDVANVISKGDPFEK